MPDLHHWVRALALDVRRVSKLFLRISHMALFLGVGVQGYGLGLYPSQLLMLLFMCCWML